MTHNEPHSVSYGQHTLVYTLTRSARKTVRIQVQPDSTVRVIAPPDLDETQIAMVVKKKAAWIVKQIRFFEQFRPLTPIRQYKGGETHRYLGRQYRLKLVEGKKLIRLAAGYLDVTLPDPTPEAVEQALTQWYREKADIYFRRMLAQVIKRFELYKLPHLQLKIRHMPTRWGSCTPAGIIYLNPDLIKAAGSCIEYVLIHELCHLVYRYHDRTFYELLGRMLPDWQRRKQTLERMMA